MIWIGLTIVLTALAYIPAVKALAIQQPYADKIILSNLTLNLLLVLCMVGALSPVITKKLFPRAPKWVFFFVAVVLGILMLLLLKSLGVQTRI